MNRVDGFIELADNLLSASQGEAQSLCMLQGCYSVLSQDSTKYIF